MTTAISQSPLSVVAAPADRAPLARLLSGAGLPVDDLNAPDVRLWLARGTGGDVAGCVGLEVHGTHALLRSLAVAEDARRAGLGGRLVDHALSAARSAGASTAWALTRDAAPWFRARGWVVTARADAPGAIRRTRQFSGLCPASATLLALFLNPDA